MTKAPPPRPRAWRAEVDAAARRTSTACAYHAGRHAAMARCSPHMATSTAASRRCSSHAAELCRRRSASPEGRRSTRRSRPPISPTARERLIGLRDVEARRAGAGAACRSAATSTRWRRPIRPPADGGPARQRCQKTARRLAARLPGSGQADGVGGYKNFAQQWRSDTSHDSCSTQERLLADMQGPEASKNEMRRHELVELRAPADAVVLSVARVSVGSRDAERRPVPPQLVPIERAAWMSMPRIPGERCPASCMSATPWSRSSSTRFPYHAITATAYRHASRLVSADSFADPDPGPHRRPRSNVPGRMSDAESTANAPTSACLLPRATFRFRELKHAQHCRSGSSLVPGMPVTDGHPWSASARSIHGG